MKQLAQSILFAVICATANASTDGTANFSSQFVTPIHCKTFSGRLVSICQPTREKFGPPVCAAQTLQVDKPIRSPALTLFKAGATHASIGRHVFHWHCFDTQGNAEVLSLSIADVENSRDEDVWLFNHHGKRLLKRAESQVFRTPTWSKARSGEQLNGQGVVSLPAINE